MAHAAIGHPSSGPLSALKSRARGPDDRLTMLPRCPRPFLLAVAALLVVPAGAAAKTPSAPPTIRSVKPLQLRVGEKLTITGKNFIPAANRNTVVFKRDRQRAVFAKAAKATSTKLVVVVPAKLTAFLAKRGGKAVETRFMLRILARRFGTRYTSKSLSPRISPPLPGSDTAAAGGSTVAPPDCDADGTPDAVDTDDDNDQLPDTVERQIGTDPCKADTDGDGVSDYFEYKSALDLNNSPVFDHPYAVKRPYPNPLDKSDAGTDFDGDSLTLAEEYAAWVYTGSPAVLTYSDGTQYTGGKVPVPAGAFDIDGNGIWSDDEKDVDGDGLTNYDETHGRMNPAWWVSVFDGTHGFAKETPYPLSYLQPSFVDWDTDGDGVPDGQDDQDHDGLSNLQEIVRPGMANLQNIAHPASWETDYVSTSHPGGATPNPWARVNPFNPCKPIYSDTCHKYEPPGYYPTTEDWASPYHWGDPSLPPPPAPAP